MSPLMKTFALDGRPGFATITLWAVLVSITACSARKEALLILDVHTDADVPPFDQFRFSTPDLPNVLPRHASAEGRRPTFPFGYYLSAGGAVTILGEAVRTADGCVLGDGTVTVLGVDLGTTTPATTIVIAALPIPQCATGDASSDLGAGNDPGAVGGIGGGGSDVATDAQTDQIDSTQPGGADGGFRTDAPDDVVDAATASLSGSASNNFGNTEVGATTPTVTWTIRNTGMASTGTLSLLNDDSAEVIATSNCPATISAGGTCTISVGFNAFATGSRGGGLTLSASPGGAVTFTATAKGQYRLTVAIAGTGYVSSVPAGINCPTTACSALFDPGQVTLQAGTVMNGSDFFFSGWTGGGCTGPYRFCTLNLGGSTMKAATFTAMTNNLVFVTSTQFSTDLGNASMYDTKCNEAASAVGINDKGLPGTSYVALTSDAASDTRSRLGTIARGWVRMDGRPFADSQASLFNSGAVLNSIRFDENGLSVGRAEVLMAGTGCSNWTSTSHSDLFALADAEGGPAAWYGGLGGQFGICDSGPHRIICMGKTKSVPVVQPTIVGRKVWIGSYYQPAQSPDQNCQTSRPSGVTTGRALLAYSTQPLSAILDPTTMYTRPDGILVGTGAQIGARGPLESGIWQFANGAYDVRGIASFFTGGAGGSLANTCNDWVVPLTGTGTSGFGPYADGSDWWSGGGTGSCQVQSNSADGPFFYCVQSQ
jgi:hypothetical protein